MDTTHQIIKLQQITDICPADIGEKVFITGRGDKSSITLYLSNGHIEALSVEDAQDLAHNMLNACDVIIDRQNQAEVTKRQTASLTAGTRSL